MTTWLLMLPVAAVVGAAMGALVARLARRRSCERRGTLELDTPEARRALRVQPVEFTMSDEPPRPGGPA